MKEKNKFYIEDNAGLTGEKLIGMKQNNYYLYRALTNLYKTVKEGNPKIGGVFRPALLSGELQKSDAQTGFNTNHLAEKLKFLVMSLQEPANLATFKKSFLYLNVLKPMSCGSVNLEPDEQWFNFKHVKNFDDVFKNKSALDAALLCQRDDKSVPLGLDFSKLIDTFVQTDKYGNYYLEDKASTEDEMAGYAAMKEYLQVMKKNPRFRKNYENEKENENDDEKDY